MELAMKRTFKIDFVEGHLLIRDNENIILVDTGSPVTMHKESTLSFLGREHRVLNKGVDYLSRLAGVEFTTLMGMDILSQYRVVFDYENEEITFLTHDEAGLEGVEMALPSLMGMILVNMQIAGRQCLMALDTGAPVSYLDDSITRGMQPVGEKEDFHPMAGRYVTPVYELEAEVGGKTFSATFGNLPTVMALQLKLLGVDGVIGYDFFKSFKVMIDVAGSKLVIL